MNGIKLALQGLLIGLIPLASANTHASPPPPPPIDELTAFYQATNGDNWYRDDHWLDEEIHHCDWYGIICHDDIAPRGIHSISLPNNNLTGDITEIIGLLHDINSRYRQLDLSNNHITGELLEFPRTHSLNLSGNLLTGPLPEAGDMVGRDDSPSPQWPFLRLSGNRFEGPIPDSWENMALGELDLSNNQLDGLPEPAFRALRTSTGPVAILLTDNRFAGTLPDWLLGIEFAEYRKFFSTGSINLCWNDFEIDKPELVDWIAQHHVGGPDFESCLNRERVAIEPAVSGSWFDPDRSGEGLSLMLLDNGQPLLYWFTHINKGRQMWLFEAGQRSDTTLFLPDLIRTHGSFNEGFGQTQVPFVRRGDLRLDRTADGQLAGQYEITYISTELPQGPIIVGPHPVATAERRNHTQFTRLAGTTCTNQQPHQDLSGAWFNPERDGEGFVVEVTEDGRGVVYWFTYPPDGQEQAWMIGDGDFTGMTLSIDPLYQPRDGTEQMPLETDGIELIDWGTLTLEFSDQDADRGHVAFSSGFEEYGSGDYPIERFARPMLAECE